MGHNRLSGAFPSETIGRAIQLKDLRVNDNGMTGTVQLEALASLNQLTVARFQGNKFSGGVSIPPAAVAAEGEGEGTIYLPGLRILDLSRNDLTGPIPSELSSRMKGLTDLYLDYNGLTGTVPPSIFGIEGLEALHLNNNKLMGTIGTDEGAKLTSLTVLRLDDNEFSGTLPSRMMEKMPELTHASFDENKIRAWHTHVPNGDGLWQFRGTLPASVGSLSNLRVLTVSSNELTGKLPAELKKLTMLETLSVERNSLMGTFPLLEGMTSLRAPKARENGFVREIPPGVFTPNLKTIDVSRNSFTGTLPSAVGKAVHLEELDVSANRLVGTLPEDIIRLASSMRRLLAAGNSFSGRLPEALGELKRMESLELAKNKFSGLVP